MGRWEPDAVGRLQEAALHLYSEQGFEQTTVAEIAQRAGLSERTFFRYFADKREVLFWGSAALQEQLVAGIADAPADQSPLAVLAAAVHQIAETLQQRRAFALKRAAAIASNPGLQERELIKLATLAGAAAVALRERGVVEPTASLTAETGIAIFRISFDRWTTPGNERQFSDLIDDSLRELRAVTA